jgi:hypothetical protein
VSSREGPSTYFGLEDYPEALQLIWTAAPRLGDGTSAANGSARLSVLIT